MFLPLPLSSGQVFVSLKEGISPREAEVLKLIADEYTTKEIAAELFISFQTVLSHRKNLLFKLEVKNTAGLIRRSFECGIMELRRHTQPMNNTPQTTANFYTNH